MYRLHFFSDFFDNFVVAKIWAGSRFLVGIAYPFRLLIYYERKILLLPDSVNTTKHYNSTRKCIYEMRKILKLFHEVALIRFIRGPVWAMMSLLRSILAIYLHPFSSSYVETSRKKTHEEHTALFLMIGRFRISFFWRTSLTSVTRELNIFGRANTYSARQFYRIDNGIFWVLKMKIQIDNAWQFDVYFLFFREKIMKKWKVLLKI